MHEFTYIWKQSVTMVITLSKIIAPPHHHAWLIRKSLFSRMKVSKWQRLVGLTCPFYIIIIVKIITSDPVSIYWKQSDKNYRVYTYIAVPLVVSIVYLNSSNQMLHDRLQRSGYPFNILFVYAFSVMNVLGVYVLYFFM